MMNTDNQEQESSRAQEGTQTQSPFPPGSNCFPFKKAPRFAVSAGIGQASPRREYRWSKAARDLVRAHLTGSGADLSAVVTRLVEQTGYPRWACWRFVRRMGVRPNRPQKRWTQAEKKRLEKLIDLHSVNEIARILHRSQSSVWHALYRMGASAAMGRDSFTKNSLAMALHVSPIQIETWIRRGWLQACEVQTGSIKRVIIAAEDFCDFCRAHTQDAVGNRLPKARLDFVYQFAFSPAHAELLPVRESKKERTAYETQLKQVGRSIDPADGTEGSDEYDILDRTG